MWVYLHTSVFGALFDADPRSRLECTRMFFERVKAERHAVYISDVVLHEIARAPKQFQEGLIDAVRALQPLVLPESAETLALPKPILPRDSCRRGSETMPGT